MKYILYSFLFLFCGATYAQLSIDNMPPGPKVQYTPSQLAKTVLVIPNPLNSSAPQTVFPTNIIFNKSLPDAGRAIIYNDQAGKWETNLNAGNLGLGSNEYGVLLTTGKTEVAFGPNSTASATDQSTIPLPIEDDPDLQILAGVGNSVRNVSILEFDFVAQGYSVSFDYVFGSEEYPEYSFAAYNDAFGFFLSGPSINGSFSNNAVNLALLPTTDTGKFDVTINNVNQASNTDFYVSNGDGTTPLVNTYTQYDGFTKLLTAKYVGLVCGQTYHIKLAIANVGDNAYDSGVFLKNFAVAPPKLSIYGIENNPTICGGVPEPIKIVGDFPTDAIYSWTLNGAPLSDTGNELIPTTSGQYCVTITTAAPSSCPIGSDCIDITVLPAIDLVPPVNLSVCTMLPPPYSPPFEFNINQTALMLSNVNVSDYTVTYYNSSYQDAFDGVPNGRIPNTDLANYPLATASQTIWVRVESLIDACVNVPSFNLDAFQTSTKPVASVTVPPTCTAPSGTIQVSSPLGVDYEYSINGVTFQSSPTFSGLGINSYTIIARNSISKCESVPSEPILVENASAPGNIKFDVTQPTCPTPVGKIVFTSPVGINYEYSINGGATSFSNPVFDNLSPNLYSIVVIDLITGCSSSPEPYTINALPVNPAAPTTSVSQPDCTTATGSVTITAPLGPEYEYSNGGAYQSNVDFIGLSPNTSYDFTVRNKDTQCISSTFTTVPINAALNVPVTPTASVTFQPTCLIPTGIITVTAPLGNLQYSKDGLNYQAGLVFNNLTPNTNYNITAKDNISGCVSPITVVFVSAIPGSPSDPKATITQPNCYITTAEINITSPIGANLEYSKDGIIYQSSTTFSGLAPNMDVFITAKDITSGCISLTTKFTIDAIPANPDAPLGNITQPTCTIQTGKIDITSPIGSDLEYSIDAGVNYQQSPTFIDLAPNKVYDIIVRNKITGCVSTKTSFTVDPLPSIPATPTATVDNNIPCESTSFTLNTATVIGATYRWTGPNGFTSSEQNPTITNATITMSGTYNVVIALVSDCPSLPGSVTVTVAPTPIPTLEDGFVCVDGITQVVTSDYTLNAGLSTVDYNFEWFEIVGGVPNVIPSQTSSTYVVSAPGTYGVRAENKTTSCISAIVNATVVTSSPPTSIEITTSDYFAQYQTITVAATPSGNYVYQIDNGTFQTTNVFNNVSSGEHKIVVKDSEGCGEIIGFINTIDYPKFFTPNGDGFNDTWNISTLSNQPNAKISIFDKFGKLIQQIRPSGPGWDGSYNGKNLPSTDYWFHVNYSENEVEKIFRAHFTLKR